MPILCIWLTWVLICILVKALCLVTLSRVYSSLAWFRPSVLILDTHRSVVSIVTPDTPHDVVT